MTSRSVLVGAVLALLAAPCAEPAEAQTSEHPEAGAALTVPFVPQGELLCGSAAAAMVLRHHGVRGVGSGLLAHLVRPAEGGIRTDDLARALRGRGWRAREAAGDLDALARALRAGIPPIVVISEGKDRWHYVVVVGLGTDGVRAHDPARGPEVRWTREAFLRLWSPAGRWMLLVEPGAREIPERSAPVPIAAAPRADRAPASLAHASALFRSRDWTAAAEAAAVATRDSPADPRGWRLLATSLYLADRPEEALSAWARVDGARIDGVTVRGLGRTSHPAVHRLLGLHPGESLGPDDLARARRRLALLPTATGTRLGYRALSGGWVAVEAAVLESPPHPLTPVGLTITAAGALTGELRAWISGPLGMGERLDARWRPGDGMALALAVPGVAAGLLGAGGRTEAGMARWPAGDDGGSAAWLRATDWAGPRLRWEAGLRADRSGSTGLRPGVTGALELARRDDRAALRVGGALWPGFVDRPPAALLAVDADLAMGAPASSSPTWTGTVRAGARITAGPVPKWIGIGTDPRGRERLASPFLGPDPLPPLRAHPPRAGTGIGHVTIEGIRWAGDPLRIGIAAFLDAAMLRRPNSEAGPTWTRADAGVGARLALPGGVVVRLDRSWGLTDRAAAWSAGLALPVAGGLRP